MSDQEAAAEMAGEKDLLPGEDLKFGETSEPAKEPAQDAETEGQDVAEGEPPDNEKPKKETAKERRERDKAYKQRLREEADRAAQEAEAAQKLRDQIRNAGQSEKPPKEGDFDDYSDFVAAKAVWSYTRQAAEKEATSADEAATQARQKQQAIQQQEKALLAEDWQRQAMEAKARFADFEEVVTAQGLFPEGNHLPDLIMGSDSAADLAYSVAKDRDLHDRLVTMHPYEAARELGRIEARMSAPKPRLETNAPEPITPVRPKASATVEPSKMSYADYVAARKAGRIK